MFTCLVVRSLSTEQDIRLHRSCASLTGFKPRRFKLAAKTMNSYAKDLADKRKLLLLLILLLHLFLRLRRRNLFKSREK